MTRLRITVTDHAVLRFLERAHNLPVERLRARMAEICATEAAQGARIVVHHGVQMIIENGRVVTVLRGDMRPRTDARPRRKRRRGRRGA